MNILTSALALLAGVVGAGFASGREIARFFAGHGPACGAAIVCTVLTLMFLFLRLCAKMESSGERSVIGLCRARFGSRLGALCSGLFFLLGAVTAGAMLAACAELTALVLPVRRAYGIGMTVSLLLALFLARRSVRALAWVGSVLVFALPALLMRLLLLPAGEAAFLPAMTPDLPVRAAADGTIYAALNAAMLVGTMPLLLSLGAGARRRAVLLFGLLFGALLLLGCAVCLRHMQIASQHPMPFVALSRYLGGGYLPVALCMYAAALSTLVAMLVSMIGMLRCSPALSALLCAGAGLLFARAGFSVLVQSAYPVLGAVCAGLMLLLCV